MGIYYTQGLILRHRDYKEADRLVSFFTKEQGKIIARARGVKKISSKLAGSLEPLLLVEATFAAGRQYDVITGSEIINNFSNFKKDINSLSAARFVIELVDCTTKVNQRDQKIYNLLIESLGFIAENGFSKKPQILIFFIWRYLSYLGFRPELYRCLSCQRKIEPGGNSFDMNKGGLVCRQCKVQSLHHLQLSDNAIKVLRQIEEKSIGEVAAIKVEPPLLRELVQLSGRYINYSQEMNLSLRDLINQ